METLKIFGTAGTGKTTYLYNFLVNDLIKIYDVEDIAYVSHSNSAIESMVNKIVSDKKLDIKKFRYFRTLHSLCYMLLKRAGCDFDDIADLHLSEFEDEYHLDLSGLYYKSYDINDMGNNDEEKQFRDYLIQRAKGNNEYKNSISEKWDKFKQERNFLDFQDLIDKARSFKLYPQVKVLLIDEAQDLNVSQWQYIEDWINNANVEVLILAGDDDQSIYNFMGTCSDMFLKFDTDQKLILTKSYRLKSEILRYAYNFVKRIHKRQSKDNISSVHSGGKVIRINYDQFENELLRNINNDVLILARCRYHFRDDGLIKEVLKRNYIGWHNTYSDDPLFNRFKKVGVAEALDGIKKLGDNIGIRYNELLSLVEIMPSGIFFVRGAKKEIKSNNFLRDKDSIKIVDIQKYLTSSAYEIVKNNEYDKFNILLKDKYRKEYEVWLANQKNASELKHKCQIGTIHSVKGGEASVVFIFNSISKRISEVLNDGNRDAIDDEYRVWFVGLTRAIDKLYIVECNGEVMDI